MTNAAKTHCPQGHAYDAFFDNGVKHFRACKTCWRARASASYYRRRQGIIRQRFLAKRLLADGPLRLSRLFGLTLKQAIRNRDTLTRLPQMKPEARRYMLKLILEKRY